MLNIKIILGSVRQNREGEKVANWILDLALKQPQLQVELLDLKDYSLPFVGESEPNKEIIARWTQKISQADGFIIVTPEYNHGYPGVLKNAIDHLYLEWNSKTVGFISYSTGPLAGVRSVEQLRQVCVALQMAPIRETVIFPKVQDQFDMQGQVKDKLRYQERAEKFLTQLIWWTSATKQARENSDQ